MEVYTCEARGEGKIRGSDPLWLVFFFFLLAFPTVGATTTPPHTFLHQVNKTAKSRNNLRVAQRIATFLLQDYHLAQWHKNMSTLHYSLVISTMTAPGNRFS